MSIHEILAARRDKGRNTQTQLAELAQGAADGTISDAQLGAWLMCAFLKPLSMRETADLTLAMANSGERLDLTGLPQPWLDKHSTGGVGDKTTIVVLPILAACGMTVIKMSGKGLGITGGTIDKLSSIPGMRLDLTPEQLLAQADRIGIALTGQTPRLAPADGRMYQLRNDTQTIGSIPLIVSSILSKKIAGGATTIVIDVKCGSGAFMQDLGRAERLREWLIRVGKMCRVKVSAEITDMSQPLGGCVGNALEVMESIEVLSGARHGRFRDLCVELSARALREGCRSPAGTVLEALGVSIDQRPSTWSVTAWRKVVEHVLTSGLALTKAEEWLVAQGAPAGITRHPARFLPAAACTSDLTWDREPAWIREIPADVVGEAVLDLGGGRREKRDEIDPSVGIELFVEVGSYVRSGMPILRVHANSPEQAQRAMKRTCGAIVTSKREVPARKVVIKK